MKKFISALSCCLIFGVIAFSFFMGGCQQKFDKYIDDEIGDVRVEGVDKTDPYTWFDMNKTELPNLEMCQEITEGMTLNQVILKIGKPQRDVGYGTTVLQFDVSDGSIFTVSFVNDTEKIKNNPNISYYDSLIVLITDFNSEIPDVYFPYYCALNNLYSWIDELNKDDIRQVRYERAYIAVAPGNLKDISYSVNSVDIENTYRLLFSKLKEISNEEGQITGGGYVKYDFLTADDATYSVMVSNNTVFINNKYYQFVDNFYYEFQHSDFDCHSFITYDTPYFDSYEIYTYANESVKVGDYEGLGEFEFCISDGLIVNAPSFYLRSSEVNLLILSCNQFMIDGDDNSVVYKITGEKDFSELFA